MIAELIQVNNIKGEKYLNTSSSVNMIPESGALKAADKPAEAPEAINKRWCRSVEENL